tara:strand:+ start:3545 stop:3796 length:252 start_codon:yes stop_codon:yes gene_type:complete
VKTKNNDTFTWCHLPVYNGVRIPVEVMFTVERAKKLLDAVFPLVRITPTSHKEIQSFVKALRLLIGFDCKKISLSRIDWGYAL